MITGANHPYDIENRKALACRAFWSDDRINIAFRTARGDRPFNLKEFVAFVISMPNQQFEQLREHP